MEDVDFLIRRAERCLEAGADMITIDAEDVCRYPDSVRADIIAKVIGRLGLEKAMFETSNPKTSEWFIKQYGPNVCSYPSYCICICYTVHDLTDRTIFLWLFSVFCMVPHCFSNKIAFFLSHWQQFQSHYKTLLCHVNISPNLCCVMLCK